MCVKPRRLGHRADLPWAVRADLDRRHRESLCCVCEAVRVQNNRETPFAMSLVEKRLGKPQKPGRQHLQYKNDTEGELTDWFLTPSSGIRGTCQRIMKTWKRVWLSRGRWEVEPRGQMSGQIYL